MKTVSHGKSSLAYHKRHNTITKQLPTWNIKPKKLADYEIHEMNEVERKNLMHMKIYNKSLADSRIFQRYN